MGPKQVAVAVALLSPAFIFAQPAPPNRPPGGGGQAGHAGPIDPARMKQAIYDAIRKQLDATDEQWDAIQPKLEKVREAQANARSGAGMGVGQTQGGGVARVQMPPDIDTPLGHAMSDLRTALEDKDISSDELVKKMTAVREAREKAREQLKKAQEELKATLTPRQEAVLMTLGQID